MLRKMSLDPRRTARSRSWCTSWKSRRADPHVLRLHAADLADHPYPLGECHQRDHDRQPTPRDGRVPVHDVAVDLAGPGGDDVPRVERATRGAGRAGRVAELPAAGAA